VDATELEIGGMGRADVDDSRRAVPSAERAFAWRAIEFVVLFLVAPTALAMVMRGWMVFPAIWALAGIALALLLRDPTFDRRQLWNCAGVRAQIRPMLLRFALGAALLGVALAIYEPQRLLQLPINHTVRWALIMTLYPVLSVYPQELAFRAFLMHRYRAIFPREGMMIAASALAFGYAHVLLHNGLAVGLSTVGGVLFAWTYGRSRSLAAVCLEHAIYGCFLFTIGWGAYFYGGAMGR